MKNDEVWDSLLKDYFTFLRFPSVSTDPDYKQDVIACADWLEGYLEKLGLKVERWKTKGHPTLFATHEVGPDKPTLMIYHHYDVQPVDPLDEWTNPPFEPTLKDGKVYARGASDNKGQCFYTLAALKLGGLPDCNLKLVIEGEEEVGSQGLAELCQTKGDRLKADYVLMIDANMPGKDQPGVTLGMRGIATMEVEVRGSKADLHSGEHGGMAYNPIRALIEALVKCWDEMGKIAVPGFMEGIEPIPDEEVAHLDFTFDEAQYKENFGIGVVGGGREENWLEPTIEINGISGGYAGEGFKTIIPAVAKCKLSARLVPGQDHEMITALLGDFIKAEVVPGFEVTVTPHHGGNAMRTSALSSISKLCAKALETVFHKGCQFILAGGSIPIAGQLAEASGGDVVFLGMALPEDDIHSPDEHFEIDRLKLGALTMIEILKAL